MNLIKPFVWFLYLFSGLPPAQTNLRARSERGSQGNAIGKREYVYHKESHPQHSNIERAVAKIKKSKSKISFTAGGKQVESRDFIQNGVAISDYENETLIDIEGNLLQSQKLYKSNFKSLTLKTIKASPGDLNCIVFVDEKNPQIRREGYSEGENFRDLVVDQAAEWSRDGGWLRGEGNVCRSFTIAFFTIDAGKLPIIGRYGVVLDDTSGILEMLKTKATKKASKKVFLIPKDEFEKEFGQLVGESVEKSRGIMVDEEVTNNLESVTLKDGNKEASQKLVKKAFVIPKDEFSKEFEQLVKKSLEKTRAIMADEETTNDLESIIDDFLYQSAAKESYITTETKEDVENTTSKDTQEVSQTEIKKQKKDGGGVNDKESKGYRNIRRTEPSCKMQDYSWQVVGKKHNHSRI